MPVAPAISDSPPTPGQGNPNMWNMVNLRLRIYLILIALMFITLAGGLIMVWYTYQMQGILTHIVEKNVAAFQASAALEEALVNQKGFVSYYYLDGDPDWLRQLGEYRQIFKERLKKVHSLIETEEQEEAINLIESDYNDYITIKDQVIEYYKSGERDAGARLHREMRDRFFKILERCETYKRLHSELITGAREESQTQAGRLRIIAITAILAVFILGVLLAFVLIHHILGPLRKLALEADRVGDTGQSGDEVKTLSRSVRGLIEDANHTQVELEKSRESLLQAEKMALVGKLAAGMAHSIRNPLTSVKMRLFSLDRTLGLSNTQEDDFEVISEEIRHIDTIVQNFLEFSRPPKLKMQMVSPSEVVDLAIQLLQHRLSSYDVDVHVERKTRLPEILVDPEQLKEVLVNIVVNGCEAMKGGGSIVVREDVDFVEPLGRVIVIEVSDDGPGIPDSIQDKVFQPFFSTKEEGTGLGLSIVARIVEEHGGQISVKSKEGEGSSFIITLPAKES